MAEAAVGAAFNVSAPRKSLAYSGSHIIISDGILNGQEGIAAMSASSLWKPQLRIRVPKFKRRSPGTIQCCTALPRKLPCKYCFGADKIISTNALSKHLFALCHNCRDAWRAVEFLRWSEREKASLASAAVSAAAALTVGFSLSLCSPAIADTAGVAGSRVSLVESGYVVDDIDAQLSPEQTLALNTELRRSRAAHTDLSSQQAATSTPDQGKGSLGGALLYTEVLIVREHESASNTDVLNVRERESESTPPNSEISSLMNGAVELPDRNEVRDATAAKTIELLIPASCPASSLVAVSAVGSMVSAASVAGKAVTQSSTLLQPSSIVPGAQILTKILLHLGGGGVAGAVGASVVYPLDTLKTRMQAQSIKEGEEPLYKDEFDCFRRLLTDEGPGSLYNGLLPQLLGIAPEKALKLTVNEVLLQMLEQLLPGARVWLLEFIAGGGGGFSQVLVTNPMEIVKVRLQMQSKIASSKGLWEVVKELGFQGLYCGSGVTLARDVPGSGMFFACYALLNQLYPEQTFWAGFLAAIPATILVTPFDVIKTRLQMETPTGVVPYRNAWHCFRVLWQQEGPRGLFKGGLVRVLRTSPQFGITLMIYSIFFHGS